MLSISLILLSFLGDIAPDKTYSQFVNTSDHCILLLRLGEEAQVTLFKLDSEGKGSSKTHILLLDPKTLFQNRNTPIGTKLLPAYRLLGLIDDNKVVLHRNHDKRYIEVSLDTGAVLGEKSILFPTAPRTLFHSKGQYFLIASLITQPNCNGIGDCEFFHEINSKDWTVSSFFGRAKSFRDSFMKGDIPSAFWWSNKNLGGIYYAHSKELFFYTSEGSEEIIKTHFEVPVPVGRINLVAQKEHLILLIGSKDGVFGFRLEGNTWKTIGTWTGKWADFSALGKDLLVVDESGRLIHQEIASTK